MKCQQDKIFYEKNKDFVCDIQDYVLKIETELKYIISEISGYKLKINSFQIAMIPFQPDINGVFIGTTGRKFFECNNIREILGKSLQCREIFELEIEKNRMIEEQDSAWNLKKCEIYSKSLMQFPFIQRFGSIPNIKGHDEISTETLKILNEYNDLVEETVFISGWIHFGPFLVFFVTEINDDYYLDYRNRTNANESHENSYKYFLNTVIENFHERWLEYIYYGLNYSTIDYISSSEAVIRASANDMFESRGLPQECIFTQISNYEYEGGFCRGKIIFTDDIKDIVRFIKPISVEIENIKKIRKMIEMTSENVSLIASISGKKIIGIDSVDKHVNSYMLEFVGKNTWNLSYDGVFIIKFVDGQYKLPEMKINEELFNDKLSEKFGGKHDKAIVNIIEAAVQQTHGTMIVISPDAEKETEAIIKEGKGIAIDRVNLINEKEDLIIGLCSIDGAIMIDPYGYCEGIGLILSNPSSGKGNPERGARYNSALNYVKSHESSIVIVVSEDGMVDIL